MLSPRRYVDVHHRQNLIDISNEQMVETVNRIIADRS